ncbi:DegT/DnrJ/EryC1/StrS family aminotransferase [Halomonas sp. LBP4]|uniref:DegT/DnrJ/EryC1/StrS family aminotransferase n=1 Tax=Halomonas sp. LBP4 TaxID=2044917 RepID=UPI000D77320B|nr:DegT/DnrJ/EryC1/StrS family aminotransferase [Halomonas sp. LBP4]PXX97658.1 erythromycin biosynthesis sensory transduction protein eryC1 [Halomonas sp. LBP4]
MTKFLDLQKQYGAIKNEIDNAISSVITDSAFVGGKYVQEFEVAFATYQQAEHCIGVGNGTDAIEILIEALALPSGSEIIVPANSFIASSEAVSRTGHRVVFADVDPHTYTLDVDDVAKRITAKTVAIMAVHLYGHPCDMDALGRLADEYGLAIIEDCAQAHGAEYKGRRVGTFGAGGTFSFYPGKNLGAYGDGGAILTNDAELALQCRRIANHGRTKKYEHLFEGRNSRLDGLQAAILTVKLKHLDSWIETRGRVAALYLEKLRELPGLILPSLPKKGRHAFHLFVVRTEDRDALAAHLHMQGIQTGVHYPVALPKLAAYAYIGQAEEPLRANFLDSQLLSLPMGEHLGDDDVRHVIDAVVSFF